MNTLNRLMVGLDLTEMDDTLIPYAAFICRQLGVSKVYFIHVEKSLELPEELLQGLEPVAPADEIMKRRINEKVQHAFQGSTGTEVEILVKEGKPLKELLHWSQIKQIDLMLVGRKLRLHGSGVLAHKLLRSGRISILFVPEMFAPGLRRIVISTDFSDYSNLALERLLESVVKPSGAELVCLHVYEVPTGYRTLGMSYEAFDERMRGFAEEKYEKLVLQFPELREIATLRLVRQEHDAGIGELIVLEAKRVGADMLVIGAKGMTAAAFFVLGSVTEKVLRHDMDIPLTVFRQKDEEIGFLDALLAP
ncbi:universal stress protein [Pontibacter sp. 172403-2]|uniref:universal stress protein n=1 Tax=Pontibacter rufus TaxID=2791028 RepID=UPI0018B00C43|nr:universal stress protein [Pontibacter sp. 172403-2]MBF9253629.1 universal stress protein [Pontibacter sp. 172403-2]